jgi:glyoxylase-like metal-dependent hydrolase (beta-lactamase superfamily II)
VDPDRVTPDSAPFEAARSVRVDDIEIVSILDGAEDLSDPIAENYPSVPVEAWPDVRSTHPEVVSAAGAWRLYVRCTLIRLPERTILVDTGVGHLVAPAWFGATAKLADGLGAAGVQPEDVDIVVITHVHDDHIGGTVTGAGAPAFPNARFVLQRADLEWERSFAEVDEEDRVIFDTLLGPLEDAGMIDVVDGDADLAPNVALRHAPGHTPGHQMVAVAGRDGGLLVSGDVFNHPMQIAHPEWFGRSDDDPEMANAARRSLVEELAGSKATIVAPSHFAQAFGRIERSGDGSRWIPI